MTDFRVFAEAFLYCSMPFILIGAGLFLRRKAHPYAGNLLLWSGVAELVLSIVFILNYIGKI